MRKLEAIVLPLALGLVLLALWHAGVGLSHSKIFPTPVQVMLGWRELITRGLLFGYMRDSLLRVGVGYSAAVVLGIPLGAWMGWSETAGTALNPAIQFLRPISPIAWIPVAIVLFGVSSMAPVFLVFLGAFFPVVLTAMHGVQNVPTVFRRAGQNFSLSRATLFFRIVLPAALPQILSGLRIALGIAWLVVVAAEMVAVDSGLGYLIIDSRNAGKRYDLVVAGMLLIGAVGLLLDLAIRQVENIPALRWGFRRET
jgi:NitT/TauT family transport system permease protein